MKVVEDIDKLLADVKTIGIDKAADQALSELKSYAEKNNIKTLRDAYNFFKKNHDTAHEPANVTPASAPSVD